MKTSTLRVPAKILLFGEYGLLDAGLGLALSTYRHAFEINFCLEHRDASAPAQLEVKSSFLKNGFCQTGLDDTGAQMANAEAAFFVKALRPWHQELNGHRLGIVVQNSFSPQYGFGSSSALLAAMHLFLTESFSVDKNSVTAWQRLRASLLNVQGKGSGYDVAVQTLAAQEEGLGAVLWEVGWGAARPQPVCRQLEGTLPQHKKEWGVILDSGVYADTKKTLAQFTPPVGFAAAHAALAADVMSGRLSVPAAMAQSVQLNRNAGLYEQAPAAFLQLLRYLSDAGLPFKTLGAGNGDAVWVLARQEDVHQLGTVLFDFSCDA